MLWIIQKLLSFSVGRELVSESVVNGSELRVASNRLSRFHFADNALTIDGQISVLKLSRRVIEHVQFVFAWEQEQSVFVQRRETNIASTSLATFGVAHSTVSTQSRHVSGGVCNKGLAHLIIWEEVSLAIIYRREVRLANHPLAQLGHTNWAIAFEPKCGLVVSGDLLKLL